MIKNLPRWLPALFLAVVAQVVLADFAIQNPDARNQISLDGPWDAIIDPYENGFFSFRNGEPDSGYFQNYKPAHPNELVEYNFATSPKLNVPGDWNTQDDKLFWYEGTIWYHRDVELKRESTRQYLLYFGAVNYQAVVYVNGKKVGTHEGGFTPFQFDISELIKDGMNSIVVKADNRRERDQVPTLKTDWWNYGGITRSVKILTVPKRHVDDYLIQLDPHQPETIQGWVHVTNPDTTSSSQFTLSIPELRLNKNINIGADGVGKFSISVRVMQWSFDHPKLYAVQLRYGEETVEDRIGFRTIAVKGEDILLNGTPIFLKGINIHEESPLHPGRAWSREDAAALLKSAKELGCNFVRLAHYPHNEAMLREADRLGLMVWSEIPVYWSIAFNNTSVYDKAEIQLREMMARDKNRASIVLWSVANETPNNDDRLKFLSKLVHIVRTLDNTRLVTAAMTASDDHGSRVIDDPLVAQVDVIGVNTYCGWYVGTPESCPSLKWISHYQKPAILSELGADALQGLHSDSQQRFSEEYQAEVYRNNLLMLKQMTFVRGLSPWILRDFRSPRRALPGIQDYWNRKGLISDKGIKKQAWYVLKKYYDEKK